MGKTRARGSLKGNHYVTRRSAAIMDAVGLLPRIKDRMELRRHVLKLAYWPTGRIGNHPQVVDLGWQWIKALPNQRVGELRISQTIGGCNNLRIIFHVAKTVLDNDPLPRIWILAILQKKTEKFTTANTTSFRMRLKILRKRVYGK